MSLALAIEISLGAALLAWGAGALSLGGTAAAALIGTAVLGGTGAQGAAVLAAFFTSSTALGRLGARRPSASDARGERRDAVQVLANGAAAALGAIAARLEPGLGVWIVTGALSAATADTWATSLGAFSRGEPRHLLTGHPVPRGTSGGVSGLGTLGGVAGAVLVAGVGGLAAHRAALALWGILIGTGGMLFDSLLGASVQARFRCPACGALSERRRHRCGSVTRAIGGWGWLDNDGVNALTTALGALLGAAAWWAS
jgi:uncharacterized protein (TIGR00297 family)